MANRRCLGCSKLIPSGSRCKTCAAQHHRTTHPHHATTYTTAWRKQSKAMREAHVEQHGWWCPGLPSPPYPHHPPHHSTDLVVDHDRGVLCRAANAIKANTTDRKRPGQGGH